MQAIVNPAYPNRIQLQLGALIGPFVSTALGTFDPRRDLEVYVGGMPTALVAFRFDASGNRYLMFTGQVFDTTSVVQAVHHIPAPPFKAGAVPVPGFALIASVNTGFDVVPNTLNLSAPAAILQNQPVAFTWSAVGAADIQITTTTGYSSGMLPALSSAGVVYTTGFSSSGAYSATITSYDANGAIELTATIPLNVTANV